MFARVLKGLSHPRDMCLPFALLALLTLGFARVLVVKLKGSTELTNYCTVQLAPCEGKVVRAGFGYTLFVPFTHSTYPRYTSKSTTCSIPVGTATTT